MSGDPSKPAPEGVLSYDDRGSVFTAFCVCGREFLHEAGLQRCHARHASGFLLNAWLNLVAT